jgi:hypothetical protein
MTPKLGSCEASSTSVLLSFFCEVSEGKKQHLPEVVQTSVEINKIESVKELSTSIDYQKRMNLIYHFLSNPGVNTILKKIKSSY